MSRENVEVPGPDLRSVLDPWGGAWGRFAISTPSRPTHTSRGVLPQ
jgi:hypothetical protein